MKICVRCNFHPIVLRGAIHSKFAQYIIPQSDQYVRAMGPTVSQNVVNNNIIIKAWYVDKIKTFSIMDPKSIPGSCDFIYQRGPNKGKKCKEDGWKDKDGFRCGRHRIDIVKCWHRARDKNSIHNKYYRLMMAVKKQQQKLKYYESRLNLAGGSSLLPHDNSFLQIDDLVN